MLHGGRDNRGLHRPRTRAQGGGRDRQPARHHPPQRQGALRPALHRDDDQVPVRVQGLDVLLQVRPTDDVQDCVRPPGQLFREILFLVINEDIGAELAAVLQLFRRPCGHRHLAPHGLAQLDGKGANAARAAVDEHPVTLLDACDHAEVRPHRARHLDYTGGLLQGQPLRDGRELAFRHRDVLRIPAAGEQTTDLLALFAVRGARIRDHARALQPHNLGLAFRRRVLAGGLHQIGAVHTGRGHLD